MNPYPHIDSIFKRDRDTNKFLLNEYTRESFAYLAKNKWIFTEKIDGTNIRIMWNGETRTFGGRTDKAQIPAKLYSRLEEIFTVENLYSRFNGTSVCLYGEGFGGNIQCGKLYYPKGEFDFILFDVKIGQWWMKREDVVKFAIALGIKVVPIVGSGTLEDAIDITKNGAISGFGNFKMEGFVLRPMADMLERNGERIITKIKHKDFQL